MTFQRSHFAILVLVLSSGLCFAQPVGRAGLPDSGAQEQLQRAQTEGNNLQVDDYRFCGRTLEKLRNRSRDVVHASTARFIDIETVRQNQQQMHEQFDRLEEHRIKLHGGLNPEQQNAVLARVGQIDRLRDRIRYHLTTIDQIIAAPSLNRNRLVEEARLNERAIRAYQLHFHEMGDELGMSGD